MTRKDLPQQNPVAFEKLKNEYSWSENFWQQFDFVFLV